MKEYSIPFFLGSSAPNGFFSLFDELRRPLDGWYCYIIKGGPGTGKSSMMKRIAEKLEQNGLGVSRIYCASDPESLDALICESLRVSIADGTSPHTLDPRYPGVCDEIVDLGKFWNCKKLAENSDAIISLTDSNAVCYKKCRRFLEAACGINEDVCRIVTAAMDENRLARYASRLAARYLPPPNGRIGTAKRRMIEAVTPNGYHVFESAAAACETAIIFEDDTACCAVALIEQLRRYVLGNGLDVIGCYGIDGTCRHLIVPEISLGFFTADRYCDFDVPDAKRVRLRRYLDTEKLGESRARLAFSRKARDEFMKEALGCVSQAKEIHDELEKYYVNAMDFSAVKKTEEELLSKLLFRKRYG